MAACSPKMPEMRRLTRVLHAYDRDEVWLRVKHIFKLPSQPPQFTADVVDATGAVLRDTSGLERSHTFQLTSPALRVEAGQRIHLAQNGHGVQVQILPPS